MNFEEHVGKGLLAAAGIPVPAGEVVTSAEAAAAAAGRLGPCVVKAQVATGKRGKAGGIRTASTPAEARIAAEAILGMTIGDHRVERLLVERQAPIAQELYAAVLTDAESKGPLLLVSTMGGMDVEELARDHQGALIRIPIDIRHGITAEEISGHLHSLTRLPDMDPRVKPEGERDVGPEGDRELGQRLGDVLAKLYRVYALHDVELVEINPLALTGDGQLMALDCKLVVDDAAAPRRPELAALAAPERRTPLEARGLEHGLRYIELDGDVGVLANGAGLTMTTMDVIRHYGGQPANFLEIGGEAYRLGKPALEIVLANPGVKSLVVNFCGAFARTDVMTQGIVEAWQALRPAVPVFFSIHGTGEDEAIALVRERLGLEPYDVMDDAVRAAVEAAR